MRAASDLHSSAADRRQSRGSAGRPVPAPVFKTGDAAYAAAWWVRLPCAPATEPSRHDRAPIPGDRRSTRAGGLAGDHGGDAADWSLIAVNASLARTWVALTWPYQDVPPLFDWLAAYASIPAIVRWLAPPNAALAADTSTSAADIAGSRKNRPSAAVSIWAFSI